MFHPYGYTHPVHILRGKDRRTCPLNRHESPGADGQRACMVGATQKHMLGSLWRNVPRVGNPPTATYYALHKTSMQLAVWVSPARCIWRRQPSCPRGNRRTLENSCGMLNGIEEVNVVVAALSSSIASYNRWRRHDVLPGRKPAAASKQQRAGQAESQCTCR